MPDVQSPTEARREQGAGLSGQQPPAPASTNAGPEREFTVEARSQWQMILRRFMQHRLAVISLIIFVLVVVGSLVGGRLWHYKYTDITPEFSTAPSWKHPMGTDNIGHDSMAQILRGAKKSVEIALMVAILSTTVGTLVGAIAGFYGKFIDNLLMRVTDLFLTIPYIALAATLSVQYAGSKNGWIFLAIILVGFGWMGIARVVRGVFLSLREKEYVDAARALGASDRRIIFRHLLPNSVGPIIVNATIQVAVAILAESALSFLGLGIKSPDTSLGLLVSQGVQAAETRPWLFYFPGVFIIVICLTVNFIGDGLRDALDPTQTRVRA
jgi:peptide/nickel transport system permease protein